jgi:hypothetical protein
MTSISASQPAKNTHHKVYQFGTAPFRYIANWSAPSKALLEANPHAYNMAMASRPKCCQFSCDHCGMPMEHHCIIVDAKGEKHSVGSSCIFKIGDCENLTQVEADVKARQKANRKRLADAKREKVIAEREAAIQAERDANGGLTVYELGVKNRADAKQARAAVFLVLAKDFLIPMGHAGDFGKSIIRGFADGKIPTGGGKTIVIEIAAKMAGRKNSKAYNAKLPEVEAEFEKLEEAFKKHAGGK